MRRFILHWYRWCLLVISLAGVGMYLAYDLNREHARVEAVELERLMTQSKVIEDNLTRQLTAINLSLESIMAELPGWQDRPDGSKDVLRHIKSLAAVMPSVRTFLVLNAQGVVVMSNLDELIGRNFIQREYFQTPWHALNPKTLYVSQPFKSVLNNYIVTLSRVLLDGQGKFAGVVVGTIDPIDMQILLNSVRYADDMRTVLVHGDGKVFIIEPALSNIFGRDLSDPSSNFSRHLQSKRAVSHFNNLDNSTGNARLHVLRTFAPKTLTMDKPLVVIVSRELDAFLAPWQKDLKNQSAAYLLLSMVSVLGLYFYQRSQVRRQFIEQRLKLATQTSGVGIWEYELSSRRYHWDTTMFDLFGLKPEAVNALNNDWLALLMPGELERMKDATRDTINRGQPLNLTFQIRRPDGQLRFMHNRAALHCDDSGEPNRLIGATEDVTERKAAEEAIKQLAFFDPLTGLPNRRLLGDRLRQALSIAKRNQKRMALMYIDLDKFKPVNDDFGHTAGDELLQVVAQRLLACVRESDTVARVGGDEFVVLLPAIDVVPDALAVAEKIHDALIAPFALSGGHCVSISSSIGIAIYPEHGSNEVELTRHADAAMYEAKATGRDQFVVFEAAS